MFASTESFFILLFYSLAVGAFLGLFYDLTVQLIAELFPEKEKTRKAPKELPHGDISVSSVLFEVDMRFKKRDVAMLFADVIFFTVSAIAVTVMLYHLNYGNVRAFSLFCALLGFVIYRVSIGRMIRLLSGKLFSVFKRVILAIMLLLIKPFSIAFGKIFVKLRKRTNIKKARKYLLLMERNIVKKGN
jgi:hypothetical protein